MNMDQALNYFKKDKDWKKTYVKLVFLPLLSLIPCIGSMIYSVFLASYLLMLTNRRIFKPEVALVEWDMQKIMSIGGKFLGFSLLYGLFFAIFTIIIFVLFFIYATITMQGQFDPSQYPTITIFATIIFVITFIIYVDLAFLVFAVDLKFASFFKFKAIKYVLIDNFCEYTKLCLKKLILAAISVLSIITIIGPFILCPYLTFIIADLNAQFLRKILKIK